MKSVAVITPCLNAERFIGRCLSSVAAQRSERLRVVHYILDGGSSDGTQREVRGYLNGDTFFISAPDKGPPDAINKGFAMADCEFVCWLNADDEFSPGSLERGAAALAENPDASMCFGKCPVIDGSGAEIRRWLTAFKWFCASFSSLRLLQTVNYVPQPAALFRAASVREAGELRTDLRAAWDYDFILRMFRTGRAVRIDAVQAYFRWTPESISGRNFVLQMKEDFAVAARDAGMWSPRIWVHWAGGKFVAALYLLISMRRRLAAAGGRSAP